MSAGRAPLKVICEFSIATFTDAAGGDRVRAMAEHATPFPSSHPLLKDRARLEKIKNNMHVQIQLVLHGRRIRDDVELALPGGASVDDVLQDALLALLRTDSAKVRTSWEALSSEIARNKAKDALTQATRGRRSPKAEPGTPDDVTLVPLDERLDAADTDPANDPAEAFDLAQRQLVILRLARETLSERERLIFNTGYYKTNTGKELGRQLGITGQAVGQQFRRILRDLYAAALRDPAFPPLMESDGGEGK
jgi:RNA polymerase sigma factor (sigma-70 family)